MTQPIRSMTELVDALRARRDELNISHETIDSIAGLQAGYTSKLLAPKPIKNLGPMSFGSVLGALGVAVVVVPDPEAAARVADRWIERKRPQKLPAIEGASTAIEIQVTAQLQAQLTSEERIKIGASNGGKRRAKIMGKRRRQAIATHAARMRWAKRHA